MKRSGKNPSDVSSGIRLNRLNLFFIAVGLVIALAMVFSMYQTTGSFREIVDVTDAYLSAQQSAGMLKTISSSMSEQCAGFLHTGTPDLVHAYAGQLSAINAQLESDDSISEDGSTGDEFMLTALRTFREMTATELHAMRLMADTLPVGLESFPAVLRETALSEEEQALSPEEKQALALSLVSSEEYLSCAATIDSAVDATHRFASEKGRLRAMETAETVNGVILRQKILIIGFVVIAIAALLFNRILIIRPIQQSVGNLDRREPIPLRGSYEVRHFARVYNEILRDNGEKSAALSYSASHDALTDLYNHAAFSDIYPRYENSHAGVMVADVDYFKQYNDRFGHDVGDRVLQLVASKLREHFRAGDFICRFGGDEFCVIMPDTSQADAESMMEKVRAIDAELSEGSSDFPPISISAGFAFWDRADPESDLFRDADHMLLSVKKARADCCAVWDGAPE